MPARRRKERRRSSRTDESANAVGQQIGHIRCTHRGDRLRRFDQDGHANEHTSDHDGAPCHPRPGDAGGHEERDVEDELAATERIGAQSFDSCSRPVGQPAHGEQVRPSTPQERDRNDEADRSERGKQRKRFVGATRSA